MESLFLIIGVIAYIIISFLIGLWKSKGVNLENFVASRNSIGFWAILFSLVGTIVGGGMFFGVGQIGYEAGILGYIIGACYIVGFFLLGLTIPKIRKLFENKNYLSMIDKMIAFLKKRNRKRIAMITNSETPKEYITHFREKVLENGMLTHSRWIHGVCLISMIAVILKTGLIRDGILGRPDSSTGRFFFNL